MAHPATATKHNTRLIASSSLLPAGLLIAAVALVVVFCVSIAIGAAEIKLATVFDALLRYDATSMEHLIIRTVRLPRVVAGVIVGAGLAVAGALMQGMTTNPLASPDILGISSGASFAVVLGVFLMGTPSMAGYGALALAGAAVSAAIVYALGHAGRGSVTPAKLTLAGIIFAMFTTALTTMILVLDRSTFDQIRFWTVGSLGGRDWAVVLWSGPLVLIGLLLALALGRQITTMSMGHDIAKGLGQNSVAVRAGSALAVILMAGGSVAIAGPVGFVGLVTPHIVRAFCGVDYRWIIPYAILFGAILVTVADSIGRVILRPQELPVGVMLAFVGAPFFIYLARWRVR